MAKHFNVTMDFLLWGAEAGPVKPENAEEERTILLLRRVPPHVRATIQTLLESTAQADSSDDEKPN